MNKGRFVVDAEDAHRHLPLAEQYRLLLADESSWDLYERPIRSTQRVSAYQSGHAPVLAPTLRDESTSWGSSRVGSSSNLT